MFKPQWFRHTAGLRKALYDGMIVTVDGGVHRCPGVLQDGLLEERYSRG